MDGTPVETYGVSEAFLAFDVPAGEHTVELRYTPQGLWAGILFSGISLCLVILLAIDRAGQGPAHHYRVGAYPEPYFLRPFRGGQDHSGPDRSSCPPH